MTASISLPPLPRSANLRKTWATPAGSSFALLLCETARAHEGVVVAVTRDTHGARALEDELAAFAGDLPVLHFPDWETLPYDLFGPHPDIVSQRIATLYRLPSVRRGVLVVPVATLMQRLAPRTHIAGSGLSIARGQRFDLADEQRRLEACGYRNVPQVNEPGDFAVRGALIDIFPMGTREPYRIELLDDEIDSIRSFDPETQRSLQQVDAVELLPAREFPLTDEATKTFRERLRERFPIDVRRCALYQDMKAGVTPAGVEYYLPLFFENTETLFDYLHEGALFVVGEGALESSEHFWAQVDERHDQRAHDVERPILPPMELYLPPQGLREQLNQVLRIDLDSNDPRAADTGMRIAPDLRGDHRHATFAQKLREYRDANPEQRVLIAADSAGRREALLDQLAASELRPEVITNWQAFVRPETEFAITIAPLERGFVLEQSHIALFTERELIGERARSDRRRRISERDPEAIVRDLSELAIGAPIVHVDHGVGRYLGLITLDAGGSPGEFLAIEYAKGDKLYVPVAQLSLVSRYSGTAPELAPLHSLGGDAWERAKRKAAEKVR
ncbi:MAG TPA: CarD family transcriptional regulator, partial [Rhodanobacteraceae bacterium]|nr:CarD family transcriptional regulator [Rhodanobacteraceae bacterium]